MQAEVMEHDQPWMATTDLPYGAVKKVVVADVVDTYAITVKLCPRELFRTIALHFNAVFQVRTPFALICPKDKLKMLFKGRKDP
jgi:hypothetical protein